MTSATGMAICMFVSGLFTMWIKEGTTTHKWVPVLFLLLYVVTSMIGLLPIPWTMTAELFPIEIRGLAHSVAYSMANGLLFASVQSYRSLTKLLGGSYALQWFFAAVAIAGMLYTFVFLPETHKKKLNEIQEYFYENNIYLGQKRRKNEDKSEKVGTETKGIQNRIEVSDVKNCSGDQNEKLLESI